MSDLPPFTHGKTVCPKCQRNTTAHATHGEKRSYIDPPKAVGDATEWMYRRCTECDYTWFEQPADAEGRDYIEVSLADYNQKAAEILALRKQVAELTKERDQAREAGTTYQGLCWKAQGEQRDVGANYEELLAAIEHTCARHRDPNAEPANA